MKVLLVALGIVAAVGCASNDERERRQARYRDPHPPQAAIPAPAAGAVIATPPAGTPTLPPSSSAAGPSLTETEAAELARAEAYRHGWRDITVERADFARDRWHVDFFHKPDGKKVRGWADIAPDGKVISFSQTPHDHDDLGARK